MVILAGGLGSRYNGLKQVDGILDNGAPLMEYSIADAIEAGFNKIVVIINKMIPESYLERLETLMKQKNTKLEFVYQSLEDHLPENYDLGERQKPWGTSHALLCAKNAVNEPFIVLNADDFYSKEAYKIAAQAIDNGEIDEKHFQLVAYSLEPTLSENGTVSRGVCNVDENGNLSTITERTAIAKEGDEIIFTEGEEKSVLKADTPVSMNFWVFDPIIFNYIEKGFREFIAKGPQIKQEYFIPSTVQELIDSKAVDFKMNRTNGVWMGVTYGDDKPKVQEFLRNEIKEKRYLENLWN